MARPFYRIDMKRCYGARVCSTRVQRRVRSVSVQRRVRGAEVERRYARPCIHFFKSGVMARSKSAGPIELTTRKP